MSFSKKFEQLFRTFLPAPFTLAVVLTAITFIVSLFATRPEDAGYLGYSISLVEFWADGLWSGPLLVFGYQMMLILVLGHTLALSKPFSRLIRQLVKFCNSTPKAAYIVTLSTICVGLFNWGLALIFGAILARKVGEHAHSEGIPLNYGLIGAAGYTGLLVWHGGFSGSSLAKVAEPGHLQDLAPRAITMGSGEPLPDAIPFSETVFSSMNIGVSVALLVLLPLVMRWLGRKMGAKNMKALEKGNYADDDADEKPEYPAEKLDNSRWLARITGLIVLFAAVRIAYTSEDPSSVSFITPNYINLTLLGLSILAHGTFVRFLKAIQVAIVGAAGILIQFPLYFGILGVMTDSGLVSMISSWIAETSTAYTYPIFTFISAGIVNVFVPSGGGQWMVQGPIIIEASRDMGVSLSKCIMAMAYGDQLTNMLQPFWALPLLGITGLRARDILPYTVVMMLVGGTIYLVALLL